MRKRLYEIIEVSEDNDIVSRVYDIAMMIVIIVSLIPIAAKQTGKIFHIIDFVTAVIFIIDYFLRLITADYKVKKGSVSFVIYPFTPMAIIDLLSILPTFVQLHRAFRILRTLRLLRTIRVFRVFKFIRYSKNIEIIARVLKKQKDSLLVVCGLAVGYILVSALVMISVEPQTFDSYFDAIYWATVSLTTVGYGDLCATTDAGRLVTVISALFGVAIVALPAGIIAAGYMDEVNQIKGDKSDSDH